jgi:imidazolonepropionase-like amidohydrolase
VEPPSLTYEAEVFARVSPVSQEKALKVFAGTENAYKTAVKYDVKTAFGADILFDPGAASRQGSYLAILSKWMTPAQALKSARGNTGELPALNPYPGKLGIVEEGALADLLLMDGNPLEDLNLVSRQELPRHHEGWGNIQGQFPEIGTVTQLENDRNSAYWSFQRGFCMTKDTCHHVGQT